LIKIIIFFIKNFLIQHRSFLKKSGAVLSGSVIVQLIPFFLLPFLSRSINEEVLGYYLLWISFSSLFLILMTLKLDIAIFVSKTKEEAFKLLQLIIIIAFVVGALLFLLGQFVFLVIDISEEYLILKPFFLVLILYSIVFSIITAINSFQVYSSDFYNYNVSRIVFAIVLNSFVLFTALLIDTSLKAIIYSHFIGSIFALLIILYQNRFIYNILNLTWIIKEPTKLLKKHKNFLIFSFPAEFINNLSNQIPLIFIASKFGGIYLAYYALINKSLSAPVGLIASSFLAVFKDEASTELRENNNCSKSYNKVFKTLAMISIPCFGILFFILPDLFSMFFGSSYKEAGVLAKLLVPLFLIKFIASPLSYTLFITENQFIDFVWQFLLLILVFLIFYFSTTFKMSIVLFSLTYTMMYLLNLILSYKASLNKL
jgi:O-antigen/teichoic acid export membrane protein